MLLMDLPEEERVSAIQYYDDYFADAGKEEEEKVIQELGSPEKAAASIKADYYGTEFHEEEFNDKKYPEKYEPGRDSKTEQEGSANQNRYAWRTRMHSIRRQDIRDMVESSLRQSISMNMMHARMEIEQVGHGSRTMISISRFRKNHGQING